MTVKVNIYAFSAIMSTKLYKIAVLELVFLLICRFR